MYKYHLLVEIYFRNHKKQCVFCVFIIAFLLENNTVSVAILFKESYIIHSMDSLHIQKREPKSCVIHSA